MRALVLGEREGADALRDTFARAGLAHLLALSGLHLGILGGAAAALLAPLGPWRWAAAAFLAAAFALWVGPTPGLARAAMMAVAAGLGMASGTGRLDGFATLALAAGLTLTVRPDWTFDLGFQLSYLSLFGILAWGVPLARRAARGRPAWHPRAWGPAGVAVGASATVATAPLVINAFGEVPPFGPVVNLVAVPLTTVLVPVGFAAAALGAVWAPLAVPVQAVVGPLAGALLALAHACASLPVIRWGQIAAPAVGLWMAGTLPWAWTLRVRLRPWRAAAVTTSAPPAARLPALP
jgi:competence protein ComEC